MIEKKLSASTAAQVTATKKQRIADSDPLRSRAKGPGLSAFAINYHFIQKEAPDSAKADQSLGLYQKDARIDLTKEARNLKLLKYVFQQIDGNLAYPAELAEHLLTGNVNAEIWFSKDGEYLEAESQILTPSGFFKVLVTRALKHAFIDKIPTDKLTLNSKFKVLCNMRFELTEHHDAEFAKTKNMIFGEQLSFYRFYQKSKLEWDLGPLHGLGPLASLDVLWIPKKIGQLFSKKAEIDPLDKYRDDPAWQ